MNSVMKEFREFISRGNVIDLAVGIIIGGAFGKIVTSLVDDLIMPPIGLLIGGVNFSDLKLVLKGAELGSEGQVVNPEVAVRFGNFLQIALNFIIVAFAVFLLVKGVNTLRRELARKAKSTSSGELTAAVKSPELVVLEEIRDALKSEAK